MLDSIVSLAVCTGKTTIDFHLEGRSSAMQDEGGRMYRVPFGYPRFVAPGGQRGSITFPALKALSVDSSQVWGFEMLCDTTLVDILSLADFHVECTAVCSKWRGSVSGGDSSVLISIAVDIRPTVETNQNTPG